MSKSYMNSVAVSPALASDQLTFADGLGFFLARYAQLFISDPNAMRLAALDIKRAQEGRLPPDLVAVAWSTLKQPWRREALRLLYVAETGVGALNALKPFGERRGNPSGRDAGLTDRWT